MDKPKVTPKDFFLWAMAMIALYVVAFSISSLLFSYIDHAFPDALQYYVDPYSGSMRFAMASIIVLFPVFVLLMRVIRKGVMRDPSRLDIWVRRWALYLTLFLAGGAVLIDLITLINYFLGGDLTSRFLLKVGVVFLIAGGIFLHILAELRGYWKAQPNRALYVGIGVGALLVAAIGSGFLILGTPGQVRLHRFDDQKVNDLTSIQYQVVNYWQQKEKLPATLLDLNDPLNGSVIPLDPQSGEQYTYQATGKYSFKLCATFNAETQGTSPSASRLMMPMTIPVNSPSEAKGIGLEQSTWQHGAGEICFDRTIDPERYPPFSKLKNL